MTHMLSIVCDEWERTRWDRRAAWLERVRERRTSRLSTNTGPQSLAPFEGIRCTSVNRIGLAAGERSREADKGSGASASMGIDTASVYKRTEPSKEESGVSNAANSVGLYDGNVGIRGDVALPSEAPTSYKPTAAVWTDAAALREEPS